MKPLAESGKRKKRVLDIVVGVAVFATAIYVGYVSVITQTEANNEWVNDCNEKYGEGNWEIREGTWEERCSLSNHIGSSPIPFIGQVSVCVLKENEKR